MSKAQAAAAQASSSRDDDTKKKSTTAPSPLAPEEAAKWHGYLLADAGLPAPAETFHSDELARKGYTDITRSEYKDSDDVLGIKADTLIKMFSNAQSIGVYMGAGVDVSTGYPDYASAKDRGGPAAAATASGTPSPQHQKVLAKDLSPSPAHRVLAEMFKSGKFKFAEGRCFLVQNHSCFQERAGVPHTRCNNVHGTNLYNPEKIPGVLGREVNPVVKMSGSLRGDLVAAMMQLEETADCVLALGTSFSGMNADRVPTSCAKRHMQQQNRQGQGLAAITIQKTPMDEMCALRIFSDIDRFMLVVAEKLELLIDVNVDYDWASGKPVKPHKGLTPAAKEAQKRMEVLKASIVSRIKQQLEEQKKQQA